MSGQIETDGTWTPDGTDAAARAFRQLHGRRLHGFALLVTVGDRPLAARATDEALTAGARLATTTLAHPERAAAWLRGRVLRGVKRKAGPGRTIEPRRDPSLESLGVDAAALIALGALDLRERAALVASTVERLDPRDVGTIVDADGTRLERLVRRARGKATRAAAATVREPAAVDGPLTSTIRTIARRTLA